MIIKKQNRQLGEINFGIMAQTNPQKAADEKTFKIPKRDWVSIMIIGNGGNENALAFKLSQSRIVGEIFVVPGNGGTLLGNIPKVSNMERVKESDHHSLVELALKGGVNLVVLGKQISSS